MESLATDNTAAIIREIGGVIHTLSMMSSHFNSYGFHEREKMQSEIMSRISELCVLVRDAAAGPCCVMVGPSGVFPEPK